MSKSQKTAFTLTELLVVIIIVGILAALAIPRFGTSTDRAMETEAKLSLHQVQELQRVFFLEHKTYTTSLEQLGYEQEDTILENEKEGTARYKVTIEKADTDDFLAVATPVVKDLRSFEIHKKGKPTTRP